MRRAVSSFVVLVSATLVFAGASGAGRPSVDQVNGKLAPALQARSASERPHDPVRVIVQGADARAAADEHGTAGKSLRLVGGIAATVEAGDLRSLAADERVDFIALDSPVAFTATETVSASSLATIYPGRDSASNPWSAGAIGTGVGIAVVDSGVTPTPDLGRRLVQVRLDGQTGSLDDTVGHGSMVAGVAAGRSADGRFIGIAPGATVYALNINRPTGVYTSDVITALKWVFDNAHAYNIRVVNLSLTESAKSSYQDSALDLAVERLWASGVFVAVASGNLGPGEVDYAPANDPFAFTVGAFDTMGTNGPGDDTLSPWSSGGKTVDGFDKP
jgi:serine protease AprX